MRSGETLVPLRAAVLGVGAMGTRHARVLQGLRADFSLAGVYDPNLDVARAVGDQWSVPTFKTETEAIDAADFVVIASPIEAHADAARRVLDRGRHLLVEKPLAATAAQAFALTRNQRPGQSLFVGHSERFNAVVQRVRALVAPDEIRALRLWRTSVGQARGREHGALVSVGIHDLDLVAYLTASPVTVRHVVYLDNDRADLILGTRHAAADVHVDRHARARQRRLEVVTEDAVYTGDLLHLTLDIAGTGRREERLEVPGQAEPLVAQALAIARSIRGSREAVASGFDGARALAVAEAAAQRWRARETAQAV